MIRSLALVAALIFAGTYVSTATAATDPKMTTELNALAEHWAKVKYLSDDSELSSGMDLVGEEAKQLTEKYPGRVEPLIWLGIVTSERASLTWGITALNLATEARDTLLKAYQADPDALDDGASTSLGVLYYRVPGFPIGWGDSDKARAFLQQAVAGAPNGRDAHYFYADFLYEQGEYKEAEKVLKAGLSLPSHPERPIWDKYFPQVMQKLLAKIHDKM